MDVANAVNACATGTATSSGSIVFTSRVNSSEKITPVGGADEELSGGQADTLSEAATIQGSKMVIVRTAGSLTLPSQSTICQVSESVPVNVELNDT